MASFHPKLTRAEQTADVIFVGSRIVSVNEAQPTAEAIAIEKNKIVAVGDEQAIRQLQTPSTRVIRLGDDQTLLPGMIESQAHLISFGEALMTLDLSDQASWEGLMAAVSQAAATTPKGTWIIEDRWNR